MKTGWILRDKDDYFVNDDYTGVPEITEATVYRTRREARQESGQLNTDVVRKVELNEDGTAKRIIKGR